MALRVNSHLKSTAKNMATSITTYRGGQKVRLVILEETYIFTAKIAYWRVIKTTRLISSTITFTSMKMIRPAWVLRQSPKQTPRPC